MNVNSERIEREFGSFGIEIVERSDERRISSLYSLDDGRKVCRTYAQVEFTLPVPPELAEEHALVLAGESIGAVFKTHGWAIEKRPVSVGHRNLAPTRCEIAQAMHLDAPARVAEHCYVFAVKKNGYEFDYAAITEIHHPQYLNELDLQENGPSDSGR